MCTNRAKWPLRPRWPSLRSASTPTLFRAVNDHSVHTTGSRTDRGQLSQKQPHQELLPQPQPRPRVRALTINTAMLASNQLFQRQTEHQPRRGRTRKLSAAVLSRGRRAAVAHSTEAEAEDAQSSTQRPPEESARCMPHHLVQKKSGPPPPNQQPFKDREY